MTLIASLLFAIALAASISVIVLTVGNAMPRIVEVMEIEFGPAIENERRIYFGTMRTTRPASEAEIILFPRNSGTAMDYRLAA